MVRLCISTNLVYTFRLVWEGPRRMSSPPQQQSWLRELLDHALSLRTIPCFHQHIRLQMYFSLEAAGSKNSSPGYLLFIDRKTR